MWVSLLLLVLVPVVLLIDLFRAGHPTRGDWMLAAGLAASYLLFVSLIGRWDFFSTWLPWLYLLLLVVGLWLPSRRSGDGTAGKLPPYERGRRRRVPLRSTLPVRAAVALTTLVLLLGSWMVFSGRAWSEEIPSLVFPLADGTWFIGSGGGHALLNDHHGDPSQNFALDIVKLNGRGASAAGFFPGDAERHEIFGETVYSPCAGTVLLAVDGHDDHPPSDRPVLAPDSPARAGNHVVLECDGREGLKVVLAHLQAGSVLVAMGDAVGIEDPLARVGNSGSSARPHLHIHVEKGGSPAGILDGEAVQVQYEGSFLVRGQVVRSEPRVVRAMP